MSVNARGPLVVPTQDGEAELWHAFKAEGSAAARERLFGLHLPFAKRLARRQWLRGWSDRIEFEDLFQLASAGLLEALDRFDPELGVPFRGYAARRVNGSVADGLSKMSEVREQIAVRARMRRERARSLAAASLDDLSTEDALKALVDAAVGLALGYMLEDSGLYAAEDTADKRPNAYESLAWKETLGRVVSAIDGLSAREQSVVRGHYLDGLAFEQIAAVLGVSRGRVSQLHREALGRLRTRIGKANPFRFDR
jgi:RNA polymerase sigma factor for flagellar operon FliA